MDKKSLGVLTKSIPALSFRNVTPGSTGIWVRAIHHCCSEASLREGHHGEMCLGEDDKFSLDKLGEW